MGDSIGPRIQIEGEAQFKKAIADLNTSLRTMSTEMRAVTSAYDTGDRSAENLTAQNEILTRQIEAQRKKLGELNNALTAARAAYGENDAQTIRYQQSVNLATADLNRMELQLRNNERALTESGSAAEESGMCFDELGSAAEESSMRFDGLGSTIKTTAIALGVIASAAAVAAASLAKQVVSVYADYEQLVGGVDTLFGEASGSLQEYAANAYKTAGLSANDYMETVTSFSAGLVASLGGDTEKAVSYADMAITDMSDNANKMGTDMSAVQNAYRGFAKQNYTMLDNLKLGYGGSKKEMERLLMDAEKISGFKYDLSSYADIVDAIHVVQTEMGITGTTALKAEDTISGSANAMKAAWTNFLVGLGDSNADMAGLTRNLVNGFQNVVKNITPVIENIVKAFPEAFGAMAGAVKDILPTLLGTVSSLFEEILKTLLSLLPELIPVAVEAVITVVDALIENLPLIIEGAFQLITALAEGIADALPELTPKIVEVMIKIVTTVIENLPLIIGAALEIIVALSAGLIAAIPELVKSVPALVTSLVDGFAKSASVIKEIGKNVVRGIWEGITGMAGWLASKVKGFVDGIVSAFTGKDGIDAHSPSRLFAKFGAYMAQGVGEGFTSEMRGIAQQINGAIPAVTVSGQYEATARIGEGIVNGLAGILPQASGQPVIIQLVADSKVLAETIFDPLQGVARQKGVALSG